MDAASNISFPSLLSLIGNCSEKAKSPAAKKQPIGIRTAAEIQFLHKKSLPNSMCERKIQMQRIPRIMIPYKGPADSRIHRRTFFSVCGVSCFCNKRMETLPLDINEGFRMIIPYLQFSVGEPTPKILFIDIYILFFSVHLTFITLC